MTTNNNKERRLNDLRVDVGKKQQRADECRRLLAEVRSELDIDREVRLEAELAEIRNDDNNIDKITDLKAALAEIRDERDKLADDARLDIERRLFEAQHNLKVAVSLYARARMEEAEAERYLHDD